MIKSHTRIKMRVPMKNLFIKNKIKPTRNCINHHFPFLKTHFQKYWNR